MFFQTKRHLIADYEDVMTVLATINHHQTFLGNPNKVVENCGWGDNPTMWFITFYATDSKWAKIMNDLSKTGKITVNVSPGGTTDLCYIKK